ncbi:DUF6879 family protein [Streptomyces sp. NPDC006482]|uniref:DUF6879 family protein n=1 Tax=Streptomyces sp. NPDC006482 TaxID=3154306 RepID=UPI00339EC77D
MPLNAQALNTATFAELLADTHHTAVHLEIRDVYAVGDEKDDFENFLRTGIPNLDPARSFWPQWMPLVQDAVARGVVMRRARIVSEPVTDYIRYEHAITPLNLRAGEDVRWLPRRRASDIPLPGNDFWLLESHARALAADVRRRADQLPKSSGPWALADVVLREAEGRLSATLEGTVRCVQNRARLVRALYERLDRLEAALAPERVVPSGG